MNDYGGFVNGYVQRENDGRFLGRLSIQNIDISPLEATYFKDESGDSYIWLKRKPIMEYDFETQSYKTRQRKPFFEAYLKKQHDNNGAVAYRGEFMFMRFRFSIVGVWDRILGKESQRLNLFVERLPTSQQTILNEINKTKRADEKRRDYKD